jgi:hypothetical protein
MSKTERGNARHLNGHCFCGAVHYTVADEFLYAAKCHCSRCRLATGSAFKPFGGIERGKLKVTRGTDLLLIIGEPDGHDARCSKCGSLLYSVVRDGEYAHIAYGSLIDAPSLPPQEHIYVGSKAPWDIIADDLPQYDELPQ